MRHFCETLVTDDTEVLISKNKVDSWKLSLVTVTYKKKLSMSQTNYQNCRRTLLAFLSLFSVGIQPSLAQTSNVTYWRALKDIKVGSNQVSVWHNGTQSIENESLGNLKTQVKAVWDADLWKKLSLKDISILIDHEWTKSAGYWSNQLRSPKNTEAFLVTPKALLDETRLKSLLAHELMHLLFYRANPNEESWVREGLALLSEYVVTGNLNPIWNAGLANPERSLLAIHDPGQPDALHVIEQAAQYGHVLQFFFYLYKHCGGDEFLTEYMKPAKEVGFIRLDAILKSISSCEDTKTVFKNFSMARFKNDPAHPELLLYASSRAAVVRKSEEQLPNPMPAYSSGSYFLSKKVKTCPGGDIAWGQRRCIRIQLD